MVIGLVPYQEMLLWSVVLSLFMVLITKFLTDQREIRNIKNDMKKYQKKIKEAQKSGDMERANKLSAEMMKLSGKQMQQNMKPMLLSFVIFIAVMSWFGSTYGGMTVDIKNSSGTLPCGNDISFTLSETGNGYVLLISDEGLPSEIKEGDVFLCGNSYWKAQLIKEDEKPKSVKFDMLIAKTPFPIPFVGSYFNWFSWYFLIILSTNFVFRKILDVQ